jgi:hypothetical protein
VVGSSHRRPDDRAAADTDARLAWWWPAPLALAGLAWWWFGGEAARFLDLVGPAFGADGLQTPALPGPPSIGGVDPRALALGAGGAASAAGAVAVRRWWGDRYRLRSRSTADLLADAAADPIRPLWEQVFDFGTVGFVYSPAGMGKTDFLLAVVAASIKAALSGEPVAFCGRRMYGARWLVVSEQTSASVESYLRAWGLHAGDAAPYVRWITWEQARKKWRQTARAQHLPKDEQLMPPWNWSADMIQREANDQGCSAVLVDTYKQWVADTSASENDTGGVRKAVVPLQSLAEDGKRKAVLVSAHSSASLKLAGSETLKGLVGALTGMHVPDRKRWPTVRELVMDKNRNRRAPERIRVVRTEHPDGACEYHEWAPGATKGVVRPGKHPEPAPFAAGGIGGETRGEEAADERTNAAVPETTEPNPLLGLLTADGVSTADLGRALGWDRAKLKRELDKLKTAGRAEPTGAKAGKAAIWRAKSDGLAVAGTGAAGGPGGAGRGGVPGRAGDRARGAGG